MSSPSIALKWGSANIFFSARRRTVASTPGATKRAKSASPCRRATSSSVGSATGVSGAGIGAATCGAGCCAPAFRRDQRRRKPPSSMAPSAMLAPAPRLRRLVMRLQVGLQPGLDLGRHRHAVGGLARIEHARAFDVADRRAHRHGAALLHPPQHEYLRFGRHEVLEIAFVLVRVQFQLQAGDEVVVPLGAGAQGLHGGRNAGLVDCAVRHDADGGPGLAGPAVLRCAALHDHRDRHASQFHLAFTVGGVPFGTAWVWRFLTSSLGTAVPAFSLRTATTGAAFAAVVGALTAAAGAATGTGACVGQPSLAARARQRLLTASIVASRISLSFWAWASAAAFFCAASAAWCG